jgi:peptidylprolyl isomerase
MKRSLLATALVVTAAVAGCGASPEPAAAPPPAPRATQITLAPPVIAPVGSAVPGIPALEGTPTDLTAPTKAGAAATDPPAGLLAQDIVVGTGPVAALTDTVAVRYTGTLYTDGTQFDSSWTDGDAPIQFPLDGVVPGFAQGIEGMQVGGRRVIVIPPALGYGSRANGPIPGNSTLVFVVDLVALS